MQDIGGSRDDRLFYKVRGLVISMTIVLGMQSAFVRGGNLAFCSWVPREHTRNTAVGKSQTDRA